MASLENQRDEGQNSALTAVVRAHDEDDVLDRDDADEGPQNQRQNAVDVRLVGEQPVVRVEALAEGVKGTGPDVAVDDAEREESQFCETAAARMSFDVSTDLRDLKRLVHAFLGSGGNELLNFRK